jgi:type II secretory pathway component GspD/PulD (secretin)
MWSVKLHDRWRRWAGFFLCVWALHAGLWAIETLQDAAAMPISNPPATVASEDVFKGQKNININLHDVDIAHVLSYFSKLTGVNVITDPDVTGVISVSLQDTPPATALDTILRLHGLDYLVKDNMIMVSKSKIRSRAIELRFVEADQAVAIIKGLDVGSNVRFSVNKQLNQILVNGSDVDFNRIQEAVAYIDVKPKQLLVEAKILQLTNALDEKLGIDLIYTQDSSNKVQTTGLATKESSSATGFLAQALSGKFATYLSALKSISKVDIVASPKIMMLNNQPANIVAGTKIGFKTQSITNGTISEKIDFIQVGVQLSILARVVSDTEIMLDIAPKISEGSLSSGVPQESNTEAKTRILAKDGQLVVLGGLLQKSNTTTYTRVPVLGDLPFIGRLFQSEAQSDASKEIIIFITTTILE